MSNTKTEYKPFGKEWEKEIAKHKKAAVIKMYAKHMQHKTIIPSSTLLECEQYIDGLINDFEGGIIEKHAFSAAIGQYSFRLMDIFWENIQVKYAENPDIFKRK